jgi:hypothetical protein
LLFLVGVRRAVAAARFVDVARLAAARLTGARFAFRWLALLAFFFAVVAIALSLSIYLSHVEIVPAPEYAALRAAAKNAGRPLSAS